MEYAHYVTQGDAPMEEESSDEEDSSNEEDTNLEEDDSYQHVVILSPIHLSMGNFV